MCDAWQAGSVSAGFALQSQPDLRKANAPFACKTAAYPRRSQRRALFSLSMSTTQQQPQQWEEMFDDDTGSPYYWNKLTGETQVF
eukprot:3333999-Rhodomonas_salina.1